MTGSDKEKYIRFCDDYQTKIPVFYQYWWLDAVCKNGTWEVILYENRQNEILACLPYFVTKKFGQKIITMPPLTPFTGVLTFLLNTKKEVNQSKNEQKIIKSLLSQLPKDITYYTQSFYYSFDNWLPFYWQKYQQTTRYSYVIDDIGNWSVAETAINIRNKINKAEKILTFEEINDPEILYHLVNKGLEDKKLKIVLSLEKFISLDEVLVSKNKRKIFIAKDAENRIHACIYLVFDSHSAYNLLLGSDPFLRKSGAIPYILSKAILEAGKYVNVFDFEGSMLSPLNDLFGGFGGKRRSYYRIYKTKNIFWDIVYQIKNRYDKNNR